MCFGLGLRGNGFGGSGSEPPHRLHCTSFVVGLYLGGCQNYSPFWVPIMILHLLFGVPKTGL